MTDDKKKLRGPIAYIGKETSDGRRVDDLTHRPQPLVLTRVPDPPGLGHDGATPVGELTSVFTDSGVVWAEAEMATPDPVGTRYGVGIDVAQAEVIYVDRDGNEVELEELLVGADSSDLTAVFLTAELMGAAIQPDPAWPDAYLEVIGEA